MALLPPDKKRVEMASLDTRGLTVAELIAKLSVLPQDAPVLCYSYDDYQDNPVSWSPLLYAELSTDNNDEDTVEDFNHEGYDDFHKKTYGEVAVLLS